jgi:hypothetical protein
MEMNIFIFWGGLFQNYLLYLQRNNNNLKLYSFFMEYYNKDIQKHLIERARKGNTIYYESLNQLIGSPYNLHNSCERHQLGVELGDVSQFELSQGRPLLSAICITQLEKTPGVGFFEMAAELEDSNGNKLFDPSKESKKKYLKREQEKVFDYWKNH